MTDRDRQTVRPQTPRERREHTPTGRRTPAAHQPDHPEADRHHLPDVGKRVRSRTTMRTGTVVDVARHGDAERVRVEYDPEPQDEFLTTPAKDGAELPPELVMSEPADPDDKT